MTKQDWIDAARTIAMAIVIGAVIGFVVGA